MIWGRKLCSKSIREYFWSFRSWRNIRTTSKERNRGYDFQHHVSYRLLFMILFYCIKLMIIATLPFLLGWTYSHTIINKADYWPYGWMLQTGRKPDFYLRWMSSHLFWWSARFSLWKIHMTTLVKNWERYAVWHRGNRWKHSYMSHVALVCLLGSCPLNKIEETTPQTSGRFMRTYQKIQRWSASNRSLFYNFSVMYSCHGAPKCEERW